MTLQGQTQPVALPRVAQWLRSGASLSLLLFLVLLPWWRHRVILHRPPFEVHFAFHDLIVYTSDYALLSLLATGWGAWLMGPRRRLHLGPWFVTAPLLAMLALTAASVAWAVDPLYAGYQALRQVALLLLYLLLINLRLPRRCVVGGIAIGVIVQAVVGLLQVCLGRSVGLAWLGEPALRPEWAGVSVVMRDGQRWLRAYGLTQHPNLLGGLLAVLLLMLGAAYLDAGEPGRRPSRGLILAAPGTVALGVLALLFTFSRGAWLAMGVGGGVLVVTAARSGPVRWRRLVPLVGVSLAVTVIFVITQWPLLQPRLGLAYAGAEVRSVDERATLVAGARALLRLRPFLGVGAGGFSSALYRLAPEAIADYPVFQPVHNVVLLLTAEVGVLGALLWVLLTMGPPLALWLEPVPTHGSWLAGLAGVLIALFAVGWLEAYPWRSQQGALILWLTLGLWATGWTDARAQARTPISN